MKSYKAALCVLAIVAAYALGSRNAYISREKCECRAVLIGGSDLDYIEAVDSPAIDEGRYP